MAVQHKNFLPIWSPKAFILPLVAIGERIEEVRRRRGVQQKWLAERAGVTPQVLNRILKGRVKDPGIQLVAKLAAILMVSVDDLIQSEQTAIAKKFEDATSDVSALTKVALPYVLNKPDPEAESRRAARDLYLSKLSPEEQRAAIEAEVVDYLRGESVPPDKFIVGDYDYPQSYRDGEAAVIDGEAGSLDDSDATPEAEEPLNPALFALKGRYAVIRVRGSSMEPRLHHRDLVLIDTFEKEPKAKRIMAVYRHGEGSSLGYIHVVDHLRILTKSNPAFAPIVLPDNAIIQGVVKKRLEENLE